jgi:hypothetical protein
MAATAQNVSFASPLADAKLAQIVGNSYIDGLLGRLAELSAWQIALTILLVLVAYDQCTCRYYHPIPPMEVLINPSQTAIYGRRDQLSAHHGRLPLWAHS